MSEKCYCCEMDATTREHVPPKGFFPLGEAQDEGSDYRKNLITVPSCELHNSSKCKDDEYLQMVLVHGYFNNSLAQSHFNGKLVRSYTRRPALLSQMYAIQRPVTVDGVESVAVDIDVQRFNRTVEHIIRGVHFHEFGTKLTQKLIIQTPLLISMSAPESDRVNYLVTRFCKALIAELANSDKKGENPEVFWYQTRVNHQKNRFAVRLVFYGGFEVFGLAHDYAA